MTEEDQPLWELLGYETEEEYIEVDRKEKEQALRDSEEARSQQEAVLAAIESGEYNPVVDEKETEQREAIVNTQLEEYNKKKSRTFDEIIDKFAPVLVGLKGESYHTATKMVFYTVLANQLKNNFFTYDGNKIDLRIPIIIMMKAGHGKKSYESFIKRTITGIDKTYSEPTSYVPEQFVGKVMVNESKDKDDPERYTQVLGHLGSDFVVIDEGYELLTVDNLNHQETLKYIRTSLDPIYENEVEKKQVAVPYEHRLKYFPTATIVLITQPIAVVNETLLIKGSLRRFLIVMVDTSLDERRESAKKGKFLVDMKDINTKIWNTWIEKNIILTKRKIKFSGKDEDFKLIDDFTDSIFTELNKDEVKSQEAINFTDTSLFNIKLMIFKMAAVRACVEQMNSSEVVIEKRNIEGAITDYSILWNTQIDWIRCNMTMTSNHPKGWKDDLHGWIIRGLEKNGDMLQAKILEEYVKLNKGSKADKSLEREIGTAIRDLKKWKKIGEKSSGNKNGKILSIPKKTEPEGGAKIL